MSNNYIRLDFIVIFFADILDGNRSGADGKIF
jgi:hypothetical protein